MEEVQPAFPGLAREWARQEPQQGADGTVLMYRNELSQVAATSGHKTQHSGRALGVVAALLLLRLPKGLG